MELLRTGTTRGSRRQLTEVPLLLGLAALVAAQPPSISERVSQPPIGAPAGSRPRRSPTRVATLRAVRLPGSQSDSGPGG